MGAGHLPEITPGARMTGMELDQGAMLGRWRLAHLARGSPRLHLSCPGRDTGDMSRLVQRNRPRWGSLEPSLMIFLEALTFGED